jgi:hypothetical protein
MTVIELRRYTLHPGQRDVLIELFDREFVETQEACGMRILGQFRDLDDPDQFVWARSFPDMPTRATALNAFYTGPAWRANSRAANATMIDVDNVLLLRPITPEFIVDSSIRDIPLASTVLATIYRPTEPATFAPFLDDVIPHLEKVGATPLARLETEPAENNFPSLPVRTDSYVFVQLASFPSKSDLADWLAVEPTPPSTGVEHLRLSPTPRSILR